MPSRPTDGRPTSGSGLQPGLSARIELTVADGDTAIALRSGNVKVVATPRLIALCEEASCQALDGHLEPGRTSVATRVQFDHLAPVPVGAIVSAEATLTRTEGRRLTFTLFASRDSEEGSGLVGAGRLTRVVVEEATFLARAGAAGPT